MVLAQDRPLESITEGVNMRGSFQRGPRVVLGALLISACQTQCQDSLGIELARSSRNFRLLSDKEFSVVRFYGKKCFLRPYRVSGTGGSQWHTNNCDPIPGVPNAGARNQGWVKQTVL